MNKVDHTECAFREGRGYPRMPPATRQILGETSGRQGKCDVPWTLESHSEQERFAMHVRLLAQRGFAFVLKESFSVWKERETGACGLWWGLMPVL